MSWEIDEATGLPKLPADHFWRISEQTVEIRVQHEAGEWHDYVGYDSLFGPVCPAMFGEFDERFEHDHSTVDVEVAVRKHWWSIRPTTETRTKQVCRRRRLAHSRTTLSEVESSGPVTKANVVARCNALLQVAADMAEARKLAGDYPPKHLTAVEAVSA